MSRDSCVTRHVAEPSTSPAELCQCWLTEIKFCLKKKKLHLLSELNRVRRYFQKKSKFIETLPTRRKQFRCVSARCAGGHERTMTWSRDRAAGKQRTATWSRDRVFMTVRQMRRRNTAAGRKLSLLFLKHFSEKYFWKHLRREISCAAAKSIKASVNGWKQRLHYNDLYCSVSPNLLFLDKEVEIKNALFFKKSDESIYRKNNRQINRLLK